MNIADIEKFISTLELVCFVIDSKNSRIIINEEFEDHEILFSEVLKLTNKLTQSGIKFDFDEIHYVINILQ